MVEVYKQPDLITIRQIAKLSGASVTTLYNWDETGKLVPVLRTPGGWRYYTMEQVEVAKQLVQNIKDRHDRVIMRQNGWLD